MCRARRGGHRTVRPDLRLAAFLANALDANEALGLTPRTSFPVEGDPDARRIEAALAKWRDAERRLHLAVAGSPGRHDALKEVARTRADFYETVDLVASEMVAKERRGESSTG
jgi:hypothetical protein